MDEESVGPQRSSYTDKIKSVIEEGLAQGVHLSQINAEGRLVIMECFSDDLDQAHERVKFIEILILYAQAKDKRDTDGVKPGLFGKKKETELGKALRDLEIEALSAKGDVSSLELKARAAERRTARTQRREKD